VEKSKLGSEHFASTEWDWLKVLLRIEALETRSEAYTIGYSFEEKPRRLIRCTVWAQHTSTMLHAHASRAEQLEYYRDWVALEKERIQRSIAGLPGLRKQLRFSRDVVIDIAEAYGMGSAVICRYAERRFRWLLG
jgi:hypothetical protein